jgi:hypothetical protein
VIQLRAARTVEHALHQSMEVTACPMHI